MLFSDDPAPHVFALPPGNDFARDLALGLSQRLAHLPAQNRARVTVLVNSGRMRRRVRECLIQLGPGLLPRIRLVTDPLPFSQATPLPPPMPPLRRRLELAQLIDRLLTISPDLAPRSALFDLSDSLARLFAEMQAEGVDLATLRELDVSAHSGHWRRSLAFIALAERVIHADCPDPEGRLRAQTEALIAHWADCPPSDPIIIAGSTGSRGTTALLMQAVAKLPQGAVVLPGFDFDMPDHVWDNLDDAYSSEDHPQYRYRKLMQALDLAPRDIRPWIGQNAPSPARNRLVSLALRPAPVTDQWMSEGAALADLPAATKAVSLIEAPSPRAEAQAIALCLRNALHEGKRAALVTPDRELTRRVAAALDVWRITPDDSAGRPLALSAPGRFLRQAAGLMARRLDAVALLSLLKHPLTHSAGARGAHLLNTRNLELSLRKRAVPYPDAAMLRAHGQAYDCAAWGEWLAQIVVPPNPTARPLGVLVAEHLACAEALAGGAEGGSGVLWLAAAGEAARRTIDALEHEAPFGGAMTPSDYEAFVTAIFQREEVREPITPHPDIMIWGTLEARVQGADIVILGGLNEGTWPKAPDPDPWLNRKMRFEAGLLLPERQIGLSAHDFQQAIGAPEVVLSRAIRSTEAQTVPSRWLNRLTNLLGGLADNGGVSALEDMRARGRRWLDIAERFDAHMDHLPNDPPAPRPAPAPPITARPRELPVTAINRLIRDPYEIYAKYVLGLRKLDSLHPTPDALLRGTVLHKVLEDFTKAPADIDALGQLLQLSQHVLARDVPWPAARILFQARMARSARAFLSFHLAQEGEIVLQEEKGAMAFAGLGFTLTAKPDRVDAQPDGRLHLIDYKTGKAPDGKQQRYFDKQLLLQAMMAEAGAFAKLGPREVARITYLGLGSDPKPSSTEITQDLMRATHDEFVALIEAYLDPNKGYPARRALFREKDVSDFDQLSRYGEWTMQDAPVVVKLGGEDAL